jgi:hypothetical protein
MSCATTTHKVKKKIEALGSSVAKSTRKEEHTLINQRVHVKRHETRPGRTRRLTGVVHDLRNSLHQTGSKGDTQETVEDVEAKEPAEHFQFEVAIRMEKVGPSGYKQHQYP